MPNPATPLDLEQAAKEVMAEKKVKLDYMVGTMIEVPRGALTAAAVVSPIRREPWKGSRTLPR